MAGTNGIISGNDRSEIELALENILASPRFAASPQARLFLDYVVKQELDGKGEQTKAYSIAIDALGRPEEFDPASDPAIRVLAKRVRDALAEYYSANPSNSVTIDVPVGGYRPEFRFAQDNPAPERREDGAEAEEVEFPETEDVALPIRPAPNRTAIIVGSLLIALLLALALWWPTSQTETTTPGAGTSPDSGSAAVAPIVDVLPFSAFDDQSEVLADGLRQQLVFDLSRFPHLRVREVDASVPNFGTAYQLDGTLVKTGSTIRLFLTASEPNDRTIVWSSSFDTPNNDADYQQFLFDTVSSIANKLGDINGVFATEIINELARRLQTHASIETTNYQCVMLFYAFDQRKDATLRDEARQCLSQLAARNSQDSTVWSSWAFMQFLDWTSHDDSLASPLLADAEKSAHHAIDLDPNNAKAHEYLGSIILAKGQIEQAVVLYERATELSPSDLDLKVELAWSRILEGSWDQGIGEVNSAIAQSLNPPGWYYIPLSVNAFRTGNFRAALDFARQIIVAGDDRGIVLALAAAIRLNDGAAIARYREAFRQQENADPDDPMRAVRNIMNLPEVMAEYDRTLTEANLKALFASQPAQ